MLGVCHGQPDLLGIIIIGYLLPSLFGAGMHDGSEVLSAGISCLRFICCSRHREEPGCPLGLPGVAHVDGHNTSSYLKDPLQELRARWTACPMSAEESSAIKAWAEYHYLCPSFRWPSHPAFGQNVGIIEHHGYHQQVGVL